MELLQGILRPIQNTSTYSVHKWIDIIIVIQMTHSIHAKNKKMRRI